jgi:hypothetical protein
MTASWSFWEHWYLYCFLHPWQQRRRPWSGWWAIVVIAKWRFLPKFAERRKVSRRPRFTRAVDNTVPQDQLLAIFAQSSASSPRSKELTSQLSPSPVLSGPFRISKALWTHRQHSSRPRLWPMQSARYYGMQILEHSVLYFPLVSHFKYFPWGHFGVQMWRKYQVRWEHEGIIVEPCNAYWQCDKRWLKFNF